MNPLLSTFLVETREQLEAVTAGLLQLERTGVEPETVNSLFRAFHTIKGAAGLVGLDAMATAVHAAEDLLDAMRAGDLGAHRELVDDLLELDDLLETWLDALDATEALPADAKDVGPALAKRLRRHLGAPAAPEADACVSRAQLIPALARVAAECTGPLALVEYRPAADALLAGLDPLQTMLALPGLLELTVEPVQRPWPTLATVEPTLCGLTFAALSSEDPLTLRFELIELGDAITVRSVVEDAPAPAARAAEPAADKESPAARARAVNMLKVAPEKVDSVLNLVGELVVAKNGPYTLARRTGDEVMARALHEQHTIIDRLATALQSAVMQMRLMPVAVVFQRFPRLVRDLTRELNKEAQLDFEGETTEADRFVIEHLAEPLTHLVRNALDHGLEPASEREAAGKPALGRLTLSAHQDGERLLIALQDDGRGIDTRRVGQKAVERGLVDEASLARMSAQDICNFIFAPGFSTAASITNVSGRGVGMDVVRRDVESLGGRVVVTSTLGQGTRVELVVPISMAVTRVLVVRAGGQAWGLPFSAVEGVLKSDPARLQRVGGAPVLQWRGELVPVLPLAQVLDPERTEPPRVGPRPFIVVRVGATCVALAVDGIEADLDVVIKPLMGPLANTAGVTGTAILGDGHVLLVLEPREVATWQRATTMAA